MKPVNDRFSENPKIGREIAGTIRCEFGHEIELPEIVWASDITKPILCKTCAYGLVNENERNTMSRPTATRAQSEIIESLHSILDNMQMEIDTYDDAIIFSGDDQDGPRCGSISRDGKIYWYC